MPNKNINQAFINKEWTRMNKVSFYDSKQIKYKIKILSFILALMDEALAL